MIKFKEYLPWINPFFVKDSEKNPKILKFSNLSDLFAHYQDQKPENFIQYSVYEGLVALEYGKWLIAELEYKEPAPERGFISIEADICIMGELKNVKNIEELGLPLLDIKKYIHNPLYTFIQQAERWEKALIILADNLIYKKG